MCAVGHKVHLMDTLTKSACDLHWRQFLGCKTHLTEGEICCLLLTKVSVFAVIQSSVHQTLHLSAWEQMQQSWEMTLSHKVQCLHQVGNGTTALYFRCQCRNNALDHPSFYQTNLPMGALIGDCTSQKLATCSVLRYFSLNTVLWLPSWEVYVTFTLIGGWFKAYLVDWWTAQSDGSHLEAARGWFLFFLICSHWDGCVLIQLVGALNVATLWRT